MIARPDIGQVYYYGILDIPVEFIGKASRNRYLFKTAYNDDVCLTKFQVIVLIHKIY